MDGRTDVGDKGSRMHTPCSTTRTQTSPPRPQSSIFLPSLSFPPSFTSHRVAFRIAMERGRSLSVSSSVPFASFGNGSVMASRVLFFVTVVWPLCLWWVF